MLSMEDLVFRLRMIEVVWLEKVFYLILWRDGRVWFIATVLKTVVRLIAHRGFESHSLFHFCLD